jgi:AraC-like DNA-binding protein
MLQDCPLSVVFAGLHIGNSDFPPHHHEVWELIYQLDGTVTTVQGERHFNMRPGMILVHPPGVIHSDRFEQPYRLIYLFVRGAILASCKTVLYDDGSRSFGQAFEAVLREWNCRGLRREEMLRGLSLQLEILLERDALQQRAPGSQKWLVEAERILRNSVADPVSLERVAKQVDVSRSALHEAFKKTYGRTPGEYVAQLRLEKALSMLRHSSHKVSFIAAECGYASTSHLSNHVKKATLRSPRSIRTAGSDSTRLDK